MRGAGRRGALADGRALPGELTIAEQIERSGAPALLLERYEGRLEYHEPWHIEREVSHLFRGLVDAFEVDALLGRARPRGSAAGGQRRRQPPLAGARGAAARARLPPVPAGASKAGGVAWHRRARGYAREETFAVGDSREDLACAAQVETFWLVANAVERDPSIREALAKYENARVTEAGHGTGVYEAVVSTLMT